MDVCFVNPITQYHPCSLPIYYALVRQLGHRGNPVVAALEVLERRALNQRLGQTRELVITAPKFLERHATPD